jgi:hypothetical protein
MNDSAAVEREKPQFRQPGKLLRHAITNQDAAQVQFLQLGHLSQQLN